MLSFTLIFNYHLTKGTNENPVEARRFIDLITRSVNTVKTGLENIISNTEVWNEMVQKAGVYGWSRHDGGHL